MTSTGENLTIRGIHHVTGISGPAQDNLDFYVGVLGNANAQALPIVELDFSGDPGNTLSPQEVDDKAVRLAQYRDGASADEMRESIARIRAIAQAPVVATLLAAKG